MRQLEQRRKVELEKIGKEKGGLLEERSTIVQLTALLSKKVKNIKKI